MIGNALDEPTFNYFGKPFLKEVFNCKSALKNTQGNQNVGSLQTFLITLFFSNTDELVAAIIFFPVQISVSTITNR